MITITVDNRQVLDALQLLQRKAGHLSPALEEIGEDLVESTKRRFAASEGPDGNPWEPNSPVTIARMLGASKGNYNKSGALSKKGSARAGSKKPLIGESGRLSNEIHRQITGNVLEIGSSLEYAAMQQFGGTRAEFPHLWGDIPARPFLGLSEHDLANILDILARYLTP